MGNEQVAKPIQYIDVNALLRLQFAARSTPSNRSKTPFDGKRLTVSLWAP